MADHHLRGWALTHKIIDKDVRGGDVQVLRDILSESDINTAWVIDTILDLDDLDREARIRLLCTVYRKYEREDFFALALEKSLAMTFAPTPVVEKATAALGVVPAWEWLLFLTYRMSTDDCPVVAKLLRLDALGRGLCYDASTDWDELASTFEHVGSTELVEEMFSVRRVELC